MDSSIEVLEENNEVRHLRNFHMSLSLSLSSNSCIFPVLHPNIILKIFLRPLIFVELQFIANSNPSFFPSTVLLDSCV
jgi:hypothetical protein